MRGADVVGVERDARVRGFAPIRSAEFDFARHYDSESQENAASARPLHNSIALWTISLDCPDERGCQSTEGRLLAADESHMVTVVVAGLEADTWYQYTVEASSPAGTTSFSGEFKSIPAGACPTGCGSDETPYHPPELPWANQSGNEAAERTVREQRENEQEEQKAKEAASHAAEEAEARKRREGEAAQQAAVHPTMNPACVVPH
ncbi:MAG TPA: hypothetical protein VK790_09965 [Solirubrobacteraceae bacterium]|nr:hypothetical protein [Solirubrobacteraceae bacterium]